MIISQNKKPTVDDFSDLVLKATDILNVEASRNNAYFVTRNAQKLEDDVVDALNKAAVDTPFAGSIQKVSGQYFPDIVAARFFGVEVKSSKDEHWVTLGGSINESTRVADVERIFLTFGKLINPVEFRSRPYQDCLSDVVVTHYPRYKIDMKLGAGETIFDKMNMDYDTLRKKENPAKDVIKYYKGQLKPGERLWWLDYENNAEENIAAASTKVRLWKTLSQEEKLRFIISAYAFFPEISSSAADKYDNFSLWLVSNYGIVSTSLRDSFSAGGRVNLEINGGVLNVSRSLYNLYMLQNEIRQRLLSIPEDILKDLWKVTKIAPDRFVQWASLVADRNPECKSLLWHITHKGNN